MTRSSEPSEIAAREDAFLSNHQQQIYRRTDRMFAVLMPLQWLAAVAGAFWLSPRTWDGAHSSVHPHVWLAIFFGGGLCSLPVALAIFAPEGPSRGTRSPWRRCSFRRC